MIEQKSKYIGWKKNVTLFPDIPIHSLQLLILCCNITAKACFIFHPFILFETPLLFLITETLLSTEIIILNTAKLS